MIQSEQLENLSNLFVLLSRIPKTLEPVVKEFKDKVINDGNHYNIVQTIVVHCVLGLACIKAVISSKVSMIHSGSSQSLLLLFYSNQLK